jgi:hypothetical protein
MDDQSLVLAAEDCPTEEFERLHVFLNHEEKIIEALCAHGPVLIRGGRGGGKSALMIEASRRLKLGSSPAIGIYLSLRNVPLLRSCGAEYERLLCELLSREINRTFTLLDFPTSIIPQLNDVSNLQFKLRDLAEAAGKRLVLLFDDVAHIGRETSLEEFFGIFRTISNSVVSCKASIYPGVTRFGIRFDVYNDATVIDLSRDERGAGYSDFFEKVLKARFPKLYSQLESGKNISVREVSTFFGRTVVGNMRGFVIACIRLQNHENISLPTIESTLKELASDYYWPLLEELEPKLGVYQPLVSIAKSLAEIIFRYAAGQTRSTTVIIHRDIVQRLAKVFEILEYVGFISKREGSRAMRSGGRGPRYALNLANLLESTQPSRLTRELFKDWQDPNPEQPSDIHTSSGLINLTQPLPLSEVELQVFSLDISKIRKSSIYPYGLTENRILELKTAGFQTIGQLAEASDERLRNVDTIGDKWIERIRSVVGQAVWM